MTPEQFCYWLQGAFETMDEGRGLSTFDHIVRDHLKTVFDKKTPMYTVQGGNGGGGNFPYHAPGQRGNDPGFVLTPQTTITPGRLSPNAGTAIC